MSLAPDLLEILVCPKCKGALEHRIQPAEALVCHTCRLATSGRGTGFTAGHNPANSVRSLRGLATQIGRDWGRCCGLSPAFTIDAKAKAC